MSRRRPKKPVPSVWWQDPYCYYCGIRVVKSPVPGKPVFLYIGTVEHIPPLWIARLSGETPVRVLACYRCNMAKNKEVQALFPPYFFHLWNNRRLPGEGRKMLLPGEKGKVDGGEAGPGSG